MSADTPGAEDDLRARLAEKRAALAALEAEITALEKVLPPVSPLAPAAFPDLPGVAGLRLAVGAAEVRYRGRDDVMLALLDPGSTLAGVLTRSATRAAPVDWCAERLAALASAPPGGRAILVNAGNANAFTGEHGRAAVARLAAATAGATGLDAGSVLLASTGVIGEPLPDDRIAAALAELVDGLAPAATEHFARAARAIMTTDTFPKAAGTRLRLGETEIAIAGIAKGSGMIAPDMATMLAFVFTDAAVDAAVLQALLGPAADRSFNASTVVGDTSTSDTLILAATGAAGGPPIASLEDPRTGALAAALEGVMRDLALQVVRDGEGATKLAEIVVTGAASDISARRVGLAIANSPLVKTALAGQDPNWGRIVMAIGKAGEPADRDRIAIRFGDIRVADAGWVSPDYEEAAAAAYMTRDEIVIAVDLGIGTGEARVWTSDLTKRYVAINADYRS
ncbi:MAG: bifunctional glutamate N-acetyltransferase/amino-acid acetyltransferase ArgJ [Paracoccaceae bacterium]